MKVTLLAYTPDPELTVASAARLCYSGATIDDVREKLTPEKTAAFVDMLSEIGHESPIEHASFTFGIEGVSRALLAQITRHRIASFSVQSQRYVKEAQFEYVLPPEIAADPEAIKVFEEAMQKDQEYYDRIADILKSKHKAEMMKNGMDERSAERAAEKKAIEDARFVLPNACDTKMIITMNARSLHNFFRHRCCNRAQWEIRDVAFEMLRLCREAAPNLFKNAGPSCLTGPCPEGKMSCGKITEMRRKYASKKRKVMGKLIVIEGLDGSGKSTQVALACERLEKAGKPAKLVSFPDYEDKSSTLVRMYLAGEFGNKPDSVNAYAASLFYAVDRYASFKRYWGDWYNGGGTVICGRYVESNAYHQMSKLPKDEWERYLDWLYDLEYGKTGIPRPDLVIFLDMPVAVSKGMVESRYKGDESKKDIHEKDTEYLEKCREAALFAEEKCGWKVINCAENGKPRSIESISDEILAEIEK